MFALSIMPAYPWQFVLIICVTLAIAPSLAKRYGRDKGYRVPLSHVFVGVAAVALACVYVGKYREARHQVDVVSYLVARGFSLGGEELKEQLNDPTVHGSVGYRSARYVLLEMFYISAIPIGVTVILFWVGPWYWRITFRNEP